MISDYKSNSFAGGHECVSEYRRVCPALYYQGMQWLEYYIGRLCPFTHPVTQEYGFLEVFALGGGGAGELGTFGGALF